MSAVEFCNCHLTCSRDSLPSFTENLFLSLTNDMRISLELFCYRDPQATRELARRRAVYGISDSADNDFIFIYRECSLMQRLVVDMCRCVLSSIWEVFNTWGMNGNDVLHEALTMHDMYFLFIFFEIALQSIVGLLVCLPLLCTVLGSVVWVSTSFFSL